MSSKNVQYVPLLTRSGSSSSSASHSNSPDVDVTNDIPIFINKRIRGRKHRRDTSRDRNSNVDDNNEINLPRSDSENHDHESDIDYSIITNQDYTTILRDCADDETTSTIIDNLSRHETSVKGHYYSNKNNDSRRHKAATFVRLANDKNEFDYYGKCDRSETRQYFTLLNTLIQPFKLFKQSSKPAQSDQLQQNSSIRVGNNRRNMSGSSINKLFNFIFQKSVLALFGAVLIHITLGTVYTLSNVNSYMTSYLRLHSDPSATYGGSIWITSMNAVGQGFAMIIGGIIEKKFSARVSCFIGCTIHSLSIASTRWSLDYGFAPVVVTYGLLPGLGTGLAYITPITNGFGWFPNRKGLVAGIILAGYGIGTFIFNMVQTAFVNPNNLSPDTGFTESSINGSSSIALSVSDPNSATYFDQPEIMANVPLLFTFLGSIYAIMQFIGCCLLFKPPQHHGKFESDDTPIFDSEMSIGKAIKSTEFIVMYLVYGVTTQGVLFMNSMAKEYGQIYIIDDMYLAWTGSLASIANCLGRLSWGIAVDKYNFTRCFTIITIIFGSLMFLFPFRFILSNKLLYLCCTLGIFGSFSGWFAIYPVHCARVFGRRNAGIIYGLLFTSQSFGGILMAFFFRHLIDAYNRYVPCFAVFLMEAFGLSVYHLFYPHASNV